MIRCSTAAFGPVIITTLVTLFTWCHWVFVADPGLGFGKHLHHNVAVMAGLALYHGLGVPLLAEIPLHLDNRTASDGGAPVVASKAASPQARAFRELARRLVAEGLA